MLASVGLGDLRVFKQGTAFLTQLHDDLSALLDGLLTGGKDDTAVTQALIDQVLGRLDPSLGPAGQRTTSAMVIWLDPTSFDMTDPGGSTASYNLANDSYSNNLSSAYVNVAGNVEVIVIPNPPPTGTYNLTVSNVPPTARGGVVTLGTQQNTTQSLTQHCNPGPPVSSWGPERGGRGQVHVSGLRLLSMAATVAPRIQARATAVAPSLAPSDVALVRQRRLANTQEDRHSCLSSTRAASASARLTPRPRRQTGMSVLRRFLSL